MKTYLEQIEEDKRELLDEIKEEERKERKVEVLETNQTKKMKKEIKKASERFVKNLSDFINIQRKDMTAYGVSEVEFKAIAATTFNLLGRNCKDLVKRARIEL